MEARSINYNWIFGLSRNRIPSLRLDKIFVLGWTSCVRFHDALTSIPQAFRAAASPVASDAETKF